MLIHLYETETQVLLYDDPRPEPPPGRFMGTLDLSREELDLLAEMVEEERRRDREPA